MKEEIDRSEKKVLLSVETHLPLSELAKEAMEHVDYYNFPEELYIAGYQKAMEAQKPLIQSTSIDHPWPSTRSNEEDLKDLEVQNDRLTIITEEAKKSTEKAIEQGLFVGRSKEVCFAMGYDEALEAQKWIEVNQITPEFGQTVLVYCRIYGRYLAVYNRIVDSGNYGEWRDFKNKICLPPTHWMRIPLPPNKEV